jgi:hypothetical protein
VGIGCNLYSAIDKGYGRDHGAIVRSSFSEGIGCKLEIYNIAKGYTVGDTLEPFPESIGC